MKITNSRNTNLASVVITPVNKIITALASGKSVMDCYMDQEKGFDTVDNKNLAKKIVFVVRGYILNWLLLLFAPNVKGK